MSNQTDDAGSSPTTGAATGSETPSDGRFSALFPMAARPEWRAHWRVIVGVFFGMALAYPSFSFVESQFVQPLQDAFGWSRAQISFAFHIKVFIIYAAPLYGRLIDRIGVRPVLGVCLVLLSASYVLLALGTGSYLLFVLSCLLQVSCGMATTGIAYTRAVVSWFENSRGTALALSRIGLSLFGAVLPIFIFHVIQASSWRYGFLAMAGVTLIGALPISLLWVRDRRPETPTDPTGKRAPFMEWKVWLQLIQDRRVLILCSAAACTYGPVIGFLSHLQPLLTSKGFEPAVAANMMALLALSVVVGTLTSGVLVDRIWAPIVGCLFTLLPVIGCLALLRSAPSPWIAAIAIVLIGLAQGAEIDVVAYLQARYFGVSAFSTVYGFTVLVMMLSTTVSSVFFGWVYDTFGNYDAAILASAVAFAVGALSYLALGRYPKTPGLRSLKKPA